jgi:D-alanine-D-alanine ligase
MKLRVGIFFGGTSREREVSFAGGRTVYDNLDKRLFEPLPIFVDHFGQFVLLDWEYVYKGSIRDFFPPVAYLPESRFQYYADSLARNREASREMLSQLGRVLRADELPELIDFAFLALHGHRGEDASIQGLFEWLGIPYSGSGMLASALGMNKEVQKEWQQRDGFFVNRFASLQRRNWLAADRNVRIAMMEEMAAATGFPMVIKPANQGSSIGVSVVESNNLDAFIRAVDLAFFRITISRTDWQQLSAAGREEKVRVLSDIRTGPGLPLFLNGKAIYTPDALFEALERELLSAPEAMLEAWQSEHTVLCESFIEGREFSCIVVRSDDGTAIALPPTEIRKGREVFDYRSKYLPGLSRKITPMDVPVETLERIRNACTALYHRFRFDVYARIDGFLGNDGEIYLNDPNTTSGMMPSSFFFHQAAEIGLNPSQFLTFIIRNSLAARAETWLEPQRPAELLSALDAQIGTGAAGQSDKRPIAVIMGGYSFERHISVESGRNIYEKLSSSEDFQPIPLFLASGPDPLELYRLPVSAMLKDNADDIREKLRHPATHPGLEAIREACASITHRYNPAGAVFSPEHLPVENLPALAEGVFISLHGRPGEDGVIQQALDKLGLYYNGSGPESSGITIDKYRTNELLRENGFSVAGHYLLQQSDWVNDREAALRAVEQLGYPLIAKPHDDGCSAAVKKIKDRRQLEAYAALMFRKEAAMDASTVEVLGLHPSEEFPMKDCFLCESLIEKGHAPLFLEITGGMLTHLQADGNWRYEIFEPSETLAEHGILSLEEKFLAGQGQNITPARYAGDPALNTRISGIVRQKLEAAAKVLGIRGYCRIDAFVKGNPEGEIDVIFIEVNSLPGMTPATCIYHQAAINGYKPFEFIKEILNFGRDYRLSHAE